MIDLSDKDPFVLFRLPDSENIYIIRHEWEQIKSNHLPRKGFIATDFNQSNCYVNTGAEKLLSDYCSITYSKTFDQTQIFSKDEYLSKARTFIEACQNSLEKVILSRQKLVDYSQKNLFLYFEELCKKYPSTFTYCFNIPNVGMWMGATPEKLITGAKDRYSTVALAGSKKADNHVSWTKKEFDEQRYVTEYISKKLTSADINFKCQSNPETIIAGKVAHLRTNFQIETNRPGIELAQYLHPTPAVGGIPKENAIEFIQLNEGHNRSFYTGFIGTYSVESTQLYVNLRCMRIYADKLVLFLGGGITRESIAEKEWEETELKAQTLLAVIEKL